MEGNATVFDYRMQGRNKEVEGEKKNVGVNVLGDIKMSKGELEVLEGVTIWSAKQ